MAKSGADVLSVDWNTDLAEARRKLGTRVALQGNVDPSILLGPTEEIRRAAREAIEKTGGVGHILNLGHGILPTTPVENARAFVEAGKTALRGGASSERRENKSGDKLRDRRCLRGAARESTTGRARATRAIRRRRSGRTISARTISRNPTRAPTRSRRRFRFTCIFPSARACAFFARATSRFRRTRASRFPTSQR